MSENGYYIYILRCESDRLYTGYTDDMRKRFKAHCGGAAGAKFTRSFRPLGIAQCWHARVEKGTVLKIELLIKKLNRQKKDELIKAPACLEELVAASIGLDGTIRPCLDEVLALCT